MTWLRRSRRARIEIIAIHTCAANRFGLCGVDEDLDVGECVPVVARTRPGDASGGRANHLSGAWVVGWSKRQRW